ncbi:hypothetical protein A0H81_05099 [Grifola frondosa]|uniref:TEA domain-containing protein n=1 Tax=Grifola frondosa TaxID=5627 RepID=A0A1C7MDW4_GRIFR|nr:hypothetical protein A0H81_05099 [Grifola frondosa]
MSNAFQTIVTERKCWRVTKDKNEVVWPPRLEAALIEGLEKYTPAESKSSRALSRFPNRNKFIARYIYETTGQTRTPKQVGSRIQQLRDTNAGKHILKSLSDRHLEMMHPTRGHDRNEGSSRGASPISVANSEPPSTPKTSHVYINILTDDTVWFPTTPHSVHSLRPEFPSSAAISSFSEARPLRAIDPTVAFTSGSSSPLISSFRVLCNERVVHVEQTHMQILPNAAPVGVVHYTHLVPQFWSYLCSCTDPTPYTIVQEIMCQTELSSSRISSRPLMVVYHFVNASPSTVPIASSSHLSPDDRALSDISADFDSDGDDFAALSAFAHSTGSGSPGSSNFSFSPSPSAADFSSVPPSPLDWTEPADIPWQYFPAPAAPKIPSVDTSYIDIFTSLGSVGTSPYGL